MVIDKESDEEKQMFMARAKEGHKEAQTVLPMYSELTSHCCPMFGVPVSKGQKPRDPTHEQNASNSCSLFPSAKEQKSEKRKGLDRSPATVSS